MLNFEPPRNEGTYSDIWIGVQLLNWNEHGSSENAQQEPISRTGVIVQFTHPGGPADRAGLLSGDVILEVGDQKSATYEEYVALMREHQIGEVVSLLVLRKAAKIKLHVTPQLHPKYR